MTSSHHFLLIGYKYVLPLQAQKGPDSDEHHNGRQQRLYCIER